MTTTAKNRISTNGHAIKEKEPEPQLLSDWQPLKIKVVGLTPLLCASPASMMPDTGGVARGKKTDDMSVEAVAKRAAYIDAEGHCVYPNVALFSAILAGAELMKLKIGPGGRMAPSAVSIISTGLTFDYKVEMVKLLNPKTMKPLTPKNYVIDQRRGVNQNTGGAIVVIRPRFDEWAAIFNLLIDIENKDVVGVVDQYFDSILAFTGASVALGAFRAYVKPKGKGAKRNAGGPYGKFRAEIVN